MSLDKTLNGTNFVWRSGILLYKHVILLAATSVLLLIYAYIRLRILYSYWESRGIKGPKPIPIFGNTIKVIKREELLRDVIKRIHLEYPDEKYVGMFINLTPVLIVRDPELIKTVLIKDFEYFPHHGYKMFDRILDRTLFAITGDSWRVHRKNLSPVFTTAKLKQTMPMLNKYAKQFSEYIGKLAEEKVPHEMRGITRKVAFQFIAGFSFGLDIDTYHEKDNVSKEFIRMAGKVLRPPGMRYLTANLFQRWPYLAEKINSMLQEKGIEEFFVGALRQVLSARNVKMTARKDFVDFLIELRDELDRQEWETGVREMDLDEVTMAAQGLTWFVAGLESSAATTSYLLYELAMNPYIQNRCYEEVARVMDKYNDELPFAAINEMEYLNRAIDETIRKHFSLALKRQAVRDYKIPNSNVKIKKGTMVYVSTSGLHYDPKYFPNPEQFDPDRFAPENLPNITEYSYLPFGEGPRHCVGVRFARVQAVMSTAFFLRKFRVSPCDKTVQNIRLDARESVAFVCADGLWLNITQR